MRTVTFNLLTRAEAIKATGAESSATNKELAEILGKNADKGQIPAVLGARGKISVPESFSIEG